uniref:Uncharacterized protein n=1 Tax=Onchocerca volvulus TaxID=6282 RepID=A0A8R1U2Y2_ONCVO
IPAGADKKHKRKHKLKHKSSSDRKDEKWKKLENVKELEDNEEEISDSKKNTKLSPNKMRREKRKSEFPTLTSHPEESSHKFETKRRKSKNMNDKFVKKKIEKDKTNSNSSSITNGSEKQAQKDHDKKIAGKGIRKKSSDSSGKIMKKANVKSEKDSEKDSESVKSEPEKKEKRKKMKKISGKKERILKTPVESGKSSDKIKEKNLALKEKNGDESENESKSVSKSEKKVTKKKSEGKKRKTKKLSEAFHESKTSKDKKKAKKHKDKTSKSMAEKDKIKKSKAKKIKSQHISKESKVKISTGKDKSEGSEKRIKLEEAAEKIKETGKKKSKISGKSKVGKKMDRVDAILPSGNEDESEKMKIQEKLRSKKKSEAKLRKHRGREVKPLEDTKITKQSTLTSTALLGCSSLIPLASSVTSSSPSISDISTSPALTDSSRVKSDISIEPEKPLAPIKEIKKSKNGKKQTIDVKDDRIDDEQRKEQMIRKEPKKEMLKTRMDIRPEKCDVKIKKDLTSTEIPKNDRKIMHVEAFTQTNNKVYDMIRRPKQIRYETNKIGETSSDITQKTDIMAKSPELQIAQAIKQSTVTSSIGGQERDSEKKDKSNLDMTELESSEESESGKIKKKKVIKESGTSNMAFSSTKQNGNSKYDDKKISSFREIEIASVTQKTVDIVTNDRQNGRMYSKDEKDEYQEKENLRERKEKSQEKKMKSEKVIENANTRPKESQDRSYVDGLIEIRTILEIYGIEKEKKVLFLYLQINIWPIEEAFNKLLDEDKPMNEKEIAENLSKAICDLPMNTELLEKVLKKMQSSGLLEKEQQEMLQKNLVPEAVNESVTIALLAQVLQRQKLKKSTS